MHYSFHSTPTCTFKSRTQSITKSNQLNSLPGPNHYNAKKPLHQSATIAHTTQSRNLYKTAEPNPGPGTYQSKSYMTDGVKRSISLKFIDYNKRTPGPQDYTISNGNLNKSPLYTMGIQIKSARQIELERNSYQPAPTSYNTIPNFTSKHGIFMSTTQRKDLAQTEHTPAPNFYRSASASDFISHNNAKCIIGQEKRKFDYLKGQSTPGPSVYNKSSFVQENASKKRGYSCRKRVNNLIDQQLSKYPSPGQYESHLKNKNTAPRCSTSQTKRRTFMDEALKQSYPGPGHHNPSFSGTKYRSVSANCFTKSQRKPLYENQKTPGPAGYSNQKIRFMNAAPKYSSTKSISKYLTINPENPGPGQYDPKIDLIKQGHLVSQVPKEKRPDFDKHRQTPGPGFYNLRGKEEGPTWMFPTEKRISFTDMKNQAKHGTFYQVPSKVVDPPSYMKANSNIKAPGSSIVHKRRQQ